MRLFRRHPFIIMLVLLALILPAVAWGMAGGGHSYSGGSSRSSSSRSSGSHSSGGGGGDLIYFLVRLCIDAPAIGIPLTIIIIGFFVYGSLAAKDKGQDVYVGHVIRKGNQVMSNQLKNMALGKLQAQDPQFSEQDFFSRARKAFAKIQDAWCSHNLDKSRAFISDGIHERFSLQLQEQKDLGYRDQIDGLQVGTPEIAQVTADTHFDTITIRIPSRAKDYRVNLMDGKPMGNPAELREFVEYWSFLRRRGAKTIPGKPGLMEGQCPNCGVGIEMNQSANCPQCKTLLRSGQYDWVLAEITQECEWECKEPAQLPGVGVLNAADPEFNLQHLEDRASVMYWRRMACERIGKIDPVRKIASEEFCAHLAPTLNRMNDSGKIEYWGECAVGSVDVVGVIAGKEWHRALVEVRWSGTKFTRRPNEKSMRGVEKTLARHFYLLARKAATRLEAGKSFLSSHCPGCGAPEQSTIANSCEFCGAVLNDGSNGWVLERVESAVSRAGFELMNDFRMQPVAAPVRTTNIVRATPVPMAPKGSMGQLAWIIAMCASDGTIEDKERIWIEKTAKSWGIPPATWQGMLDAARNNALEVPQPKDKAEARDWLIDMTRSALADGNLSSAEERLLLATAEKFGYSKVDIRLMISLVKSELYQAAKLQISETKIMKRAS